MRIIPLLSKEIDDITKAQKVLASAEKRLQTAQRTLNKLKVDVELRHIRDKGEFDSQEEEEDQIADISVITDDHKYLICYGKYELENLQAKNK